MQTNVSDFLTQNGMNGYTLDVQKEARTFTQEMRKGLRGEASTLRMLPSYIETDKPAPEGERVIALDAGGTHFRAATLAFGPGRVPVIENFSDHPMPGTRGTITAPEFFAQIAEIVKPLLPISRKIGFCFSYPAEITPGRDGKLLAMTKEVSITGLAGLALGAELQKYLGPAQITVLNDTTACLLGGMGDIGFILGTGTNTCYIEQKKNIVKCYGPEEPGRMIVNLESGNYGLLPAGTVDTELDLESQDPGRQKLEKMVSGVYFAKILRRTLEKAAAAGLFAPENIGPFGMPEVDRFCENPQQDGFFSSLTAGNAPDRQTLLDIIDGLYERAVRITLTQMLGIVSGGAKQARVVVEGTFFEKSKTFRGKLDAYLQQYRAQGLDIQLAKAQNATLAGAAAAALLAP